jgi:hypothetical protein
MNSSRKKPGVAYWATVVLVVVLAYPLSYGPVIALDRMGLIPQAILRPLAIIYRPIDGILRAGPDTPKRLLWWYVKLWQ